MSATWTCPVCGADVLGSFCPFQSDERHVEHEVRREARRAALLEAAALTRKMAEDGEDHGTLEPGALRILDHLTETFSSMGTET